MNCKDGVCEIEEDSMESLAKRRVMRKKSIEEMLEERKHE